MFALEGKVALVTGASQGLGRGLAITLVRHGCSVVLAARQRDKLEAVRHEIEAAGGAALVVHCDLVLCTNLRGAFLMAQAAACRMIANRVAGSIINMVSVLGLGVVGHLAPD